MRHIPNILSGTRILMIPIFVVLMMHNHTFAAGITLALSGLTDLLDGFLARKFGWVSPLGKVLDPAADKLTQVTVCIVLAIRLRRYWPFFALLLTKDAIMLILGGYLLAKGVKMEGAKWFGKVVTTLFYITMASIVFLPSMPGWLTTTLLAVTTIAAVAAGLMYIPEFLRYKRQSRCKSTEAEEPL